MAMRDRYQVETVPMQRGRKRIGSYLVEAGLLTPAQIDVILNDQKMTGMRFGEIIAQRGWVKEQTVEYLMKKVIIPEREQARRGEPQRQPETRPEAIAPPSVPQRRAETPPITKPLTSNPLSKGDGDVSWVG